MRDDIGIKEVGINEVVQLTKTITELKAAYQKEYFEDKYQDKEKLIIIAHIQDRPAGYLIGYDKFGDNSLYCWMVGVNPKFRRKGVLKKLMDYQNNWATEKGYNKIKITTRNTRRNMLSYLVKYGFLFTEVTSHTNINENRIHLEKEI